MKSYLSWNLTWHERLRDAKYYLNWNLWYSKNHPVVQVSVKSRVANDSRSKLFCLEDRNVSELLAWACLALSSKDASAGSKELVEPDGAQEEGEGYRTRTRPACTSVLSYGTARRETYSRTPQHQIVVLQQLQNSDVYYIVFRLNIDVAWHYLM